MRLKIRLNVLGDLLNNLPSAQEISANPFPPPGPFSAPETQVGANRDGGGREGGSSWGSGGSGGVSAREAQAPAGRGGSGSAGGEQNGGAQAGVGGNRAGGAEGADAGGGGIGGLGGLGGVGGVGGLGGVGGVGGLGGVGGDDSRSGSEEDGTSDGEGMGGRDKKKGKRYHRHTAQQIQEMERLFRECPHPDERQRQQLSQRLSLAPRQVKFWFQNRRTQMKAQTERAENAMLRQENDRLCSEAQTERAENAMLRQENDRLRSEVMRLRSVLAGAACPACHTRLVPGSGGDPMHDASAVAAQLMEENAHLKNEIERVSMLAARQLAARGAVDPMGPATVAALNAAAAGGMQAAGIGAGGGNSAAAGNAGGGGGNGDGGMDGIGGMAGNGGEQLNRTEYRLRFPNCVGDGPPGLSIEASRARGVVSLNALALVELFMDPVKWAEMLPSLVSRAVVVDVICVGNEPTQRNGTLQLKHAFSSPLTPLPPSLPHQMYLETQMLTPQVPTREAFFLRYCKQLSPTCWAVVDVSVDRLRSEPPPVMLKCRRRPSGILIQETPNGSSQVTLVEHVEADPLGVPPLFRCVLGVPPLFRWALD
ncbi:unnamed protein product [Closterium sp. Yama58-4]|nr:unnamed protein product [Closterium sp. Yama58-4]